MPHENPLPLVGFRELHRQLGAGRTERAFRVWLWRNIRDGRFPAPLVISPNSRAWTAESITSWRQSLAPVSYAPHGPTQAA